MRRVQIIPESAFRLYGAMVAKEIELAKKKKGTFHRSGARAKNKAKWSHSSYAGWINIARGMGEVVLIEVHSKKAGIPLSVLLGSLLYLVEGEHWSTNLAKNPPSPVDLIVWWAGIVSHPRFVCKQNLDQQDLASLWLQTKRLFRKLGVATGNSEPESSVGQVQLPLDH